MELNNTRASCPSEASSVLSSDSDNKDDEISTQIGGRAKDFRGKDVLELSEQQNKIIPVHQRKEPSYPEEKDQESSSGNDSSASDEEELLLKASSYSTPTACVKSVREEVHEDPICTRTRARHSLADYTLEELETFLQESDDDDDLHNVDDEEEYRKFLAAVLLEETNIGDGKQEYEKLDEDEDEDDDADFVVEIEEALESDIDEDFNKSVLQSDDNECTHRPETRQKKRLKESAKSTKQYVGLAKVPLRPKLPQMAPFPITADQCSFTNGTLGCFPPFLSSNVSLGFDNNQLNQLYYLIHEHVQLLIQVFSVCVLDPSQQQVACKVQSMIKEMIIRYEDALASRKMPYDVSCFQPPNFGVSLQVDTCQTTRLCKWTPSLDPPILSILDVAPLRLAKNYLTDVSAIVAQYRQRCLGHPDGRNHLKKEPLFPSPMALSQIEADGEAIQGFNVAEVRATTPCLTGVVQPKKSLAATLVENTKKQSVALVPADIVEAAQRFSPLFNAALYPHKPPVPAVANRVLFTDAEDGLLAMGFLTYNNDWEAIQKQFLPCKSTHQIFVRQKNRCSSKAPENPIKAVRRMKTSPLTADEKALISKGLKLFKNDWLSVWKYFLPHRDPSLLPRQWRIAIGTQKSYKKNEAVREKRRLYEAERRRLKASIADAKSSGQEVDNGGDNSGVEMETEYEAYVHEAFLADSEPVASNQLPHDNTPACRSSTQSSNIMHYDSTMLGDSSTNQLLNAKCSSLNSFSSKHASVITKANTGGSQLCILPNLTCKTKGSKVVKLAPELPPINLPSSVRIISQSDLKLRHGGSLNNHASGMSRDVIADISKLSSGLSDKSQHDTEACATQPIREQNANERELQMHPLLFQVPNDNALSYSVNNYFTASATRGSPLQNDYRSFRHRQVSTEDSNIDSQNNREGSSDLCTIDFHPLLQRSNSARADPAIGSSSGPSDPGVLLADRNFDNSEEPSCTLRKVLHVSQHKFYGSHLYLQEKESNLDLDISLTSVTKEKEIGRDHTTNNGLVRRTNGTSEQHMSEKSPYAHCTFFPRSEDKLPGVSASSVDHPIVRCDKAANSLDVLQVGSNCPLQSEKHSCSDSLPGIVMEQEELSDSVEEGEELEFEHEEIDDSEGDDMDTAVSESRVKEWAAFTPSGGSFQAYHGSNELNKLRTHESGKEDENHSGTLSVNQTLDRCESRQMPKHQNAKAAAKTSKDSQNVQSSMPKQQKGARERKSNSKLRSSESNRAHVLPEKDCKAVTSRKKRRRTICK